MIGKLKKSKSDNLTLFIFMLATMMVISIFLPEKFLRLVNFLTMASQFPEYGLLALGIMLAMMTGGIDLSVGSVIALLGVLFVEMVGKYAVPWPLAIAVVSSCHLARNPPLGGRPTNATPASARSAAVGFRFMLLRLLSAPGGARTW